jgi:UDP-N-acetylmuramoyl-L-alanyl-D-glutamate--2,6-diaminopimelate ligase
MKQQIPPTIRPDQVIPVAFASLVANFALDFAHAGDVQLFGISMNTGDLRPGDLFVAMPGNKSHGALYVNQAIESGAVAVITDSAGLELISSREVPIAIMEDPREKLGALAAFVYGNSAEVMPKLFATTGTNGKTSTTYLLDAILRQLGKTTGLTSTAERHIAGEVVVSRLTTPESTEMHALIARMREHGVTDISIEVSAQAMTQRRVDGLIFDVVGFTNLSHDHLDDYGTMENYFKAKASLFTSAHARRGVVCLDSEYGEKFAAASHIPVFSITSKSEVVADWKVEVTEETPSRTGFVLTDNQGRALTTHIPIIGAHMAHNAALAIVMLVQAGYEFEKMKSALKNGIDVYMPGRTERVSGNSGPDVYVDFGHSPDAFLNTLAAVRKVTTGKLIMVFGADGDRDATKRPAMAQVSAQGSDLLVITDHHPRFEDPASIRRTLVDAAKTARPGLEVIEVSPPEQAIRVAVSKAKPGDSILWAGPGHQDYRDIRGVRTPYSARAEARAALLEAGWN